MPLFDRSREIDLQLFSSCLLRGQRHNDNNFSISPHRKNSVHSYPVCPRPVLTWISTHRKSRRFASFPNPDNVFARAVQRTKAALFRADVTSAGTNKAIRKADTWRIFDKWQPETQQPLCASSGTAPLALVHPNIDGFFL